MSFIYNAVMAKIEIQVHVHVSVDMPYLTINEHYGTLVLML
jgi:hypothetical protein